MILKAAVKYLAITTKVNSGSESREFAYTSGDVRLDSGLGRSPGERNGNPLQYSSLENS